MNALLEDIRSKGLSVTVDNGQILVTPKQLITDDIRAQIKANKAELITAINLAALVEKLIADACKDLTITPEQFRGELERGGDIPDILAGDISAECLRLTAITIDGLHYKWAS